MKHPNFFDWLVYRLFRKVWNPILKENYNLRVGLLNEFLKWEAKKGAYETVSEFLRDSYWKERIFLEKIE